MIFPFSLLSILDSSSSSGSWIKIFDTADLIQEVIPAEHVVYFRQITVIANLPELTQFDYQASDPTQDIISSDEEYATAWIAASGVVMHIGQQFGVAVASRYSTKLLNQGFEVSQVLNSDLSGGFDAVQIPVDQPLYVKIDSGLTGSNTIRVLLEGQIQPMTSGQIILNLTTSGGSGTLNLAGQTLVVT